MTHAEKILASLERFRCIDCGHPVGKDARGSAQCIPCLEREMMLEGRIETFSLGRAPTQEELKRIKGGAA